MVGSLKMAPIRFPASTASLRTLSSVSSRDLHDRLYVSHVDVSKCGSIHCCSSSCVA